LILSNYWQFQLFLFVFLITSFLQMDWLTQLMENNNGFLEQLTLDQWSPCVVDYCCCCCCSQLVHPCEERKKRLFPNTLLPLVWELVTLVVVKTRVLSQTHSPDHKKGLV
jgi:predicted CDP-diglyceride synthetase/phosphatidate cytidylyltransferase